ncbi:HAD family hydrolase [Companilactobacillus kedongensis]|uniref:HAD family hydrolase n=1 Tax=Companilactobacillus kedongensis TaxID=2486004 RepID=UPI000F78C398|nr:HAD family hydrolase [Companilactobacillus kedongensis]
MKLVITDLDSTFLDKDKHYDVDHFNRIKYELKKRGIEFAACTGKQAEKVEEIMGTDLWIVGDGGARIKHNGKFYYKNLIPNKLGQEFIVALKNLNIDFNIVASTEERSYIANNRTKPEIDRIKKSYHLVTEISDFKQITQDFTKISVYDAEGHTFDYYKKLDSFKDRLFIVAPEPTWIDISNLGAHKGSGIEKLQEILGCTKDETICFGDGYNDLEMFNQSGVKFAMGNAFDDVKDKADFVIKTNNQDGVLRALDKLLLI